MKFQKGNKFSPKIPWNKNKTGIYSKEVLEKMSNSHKGYIFTEQQKKNMSLAQSNRLPPTKETREKLRKASMGNKYGIGNKASSGKIPWNKGKKYFRIKDRTKLKKGKRRSSPAGMEWKKNIYKRDNWKCRLKNDECSGKIEAHHIFNWVDYPELRYIISNGITLCHFHHPRGRVNEQRMIPIFQELIKYGKFSNVKRSWKSIR